MFRIKWRMSVIFLAAAMGGCFWLAAASEAQKPARSQTAASLPRPLMPAYELMDLFNEPLYSELRTLMHQNPSEHRWKAIEQDGLRFAEIANLVAIRKMAAENPKMWGQYSEAMWQAGASLSQAARKHDSQGMDTAYQSLIQSCNDCHQHLAPGYSPILKP